jgi:hypothetical protein
MVIYKRFAIIMFCAILCLFVFVGCATTTASISGQREGNFPLVNIATKDFTPLGLVFVETEVEHSRRRNSVTATGQILTYQALLREAQKLGADAIINVVIDVKTICRGEKINFLIFTLSDTENRREVWYGSALAVKYGDKLTDGDIVSVGNSLALTLPLAVSNENDSRRSNSRWFNPFTWFN